MVLRRSFALAMALSLAASPALAVEIGPEGGALSVDVHAFASQGFLVTTSNNYLVTDSVHGSFALSEAGINFTKSITDELRLGVQLFAQDFGVAGNYNVKADWFYLDYRFKDWLGFRAGRLKLPFGFYNEVNDIDSARVPILLPQSVYPLQARSYFFAQTGGELYGFARSPYAGAIDYRVFSGTIYIDPALVIPPGSTVQLKLNVPYVVGTNLLWETPVEGLRLGGTMLAVRLDTTAFIPSLAPIPLRTQSLLWIGSADYSVHNLVLSAEYSRWYTTQDSPAPGNTFRMLSEHAYAMATYRATSFFQPGFYYSLFYPDVHNREGRANRQHDWAATLRFDIDTHWIVKLEGHYMAGTAGLMNPLAIDPTPINHLDRYWGVFVVKTTAYF
jgi:hypothetical protein